MFSSKNNSSSCTLFHTLPLYGKWSFIWEYEPVQMSVERIRCSQKQKFEEGIKRYSRKWKREEEIICIYLSVCDPFLSVFLDVPDEWCWSCRSDFIWIVIRPSHVFLSRSLRDADWMLIWWHVGDGESRALITVKSSTKTHFLPKWGRLQPQSCASACAFDGCYSSDAALKVHPQWDKLHWIINGLWWLTSVQARHASCASSLVHTEGAKELPVTHTGGALSA